MLTLATDRIDGPEPALSAIELSDGTPLSYTDIGHGPVVLLVHGWAASGRFFDRLALSLSEDFRVITPDLRAHGETPAGGDDLHVDRLADDLQELMERLELADVIATGWSMGALVLWRQIARYGHDRLSGLVIEDMSPRILNGADWSLGMSSGLDAQNSARVAQTIRSEWSSYAATFAPRMFSRERAQRDPGLVEDVRDRLSRRDPAAMADLWTSMAKQDVRADLPAMNLPVLVTYGERSQAYGPETSRFLVETLPDATQRAFARSGHAPHLEEPEEFARAVSDFARRVTSRRSTKQSVEGRSNS